MKNVGTTNWDKYTEEDWKEAEKIFIDYVNNYTDYEVEEMQIILKKKKEAGETLNEGEWKILNWNTKNETI